MYIRWQGTRLDCLNLPAGLRLGCRKMAGLNRQAGADVEYTGIW